MTLSLQQKIQGEAYYLVKWQCILLIICAVFLFIFNQKIGLSFLLGGFAYSLPNICFVSFVFRYGKASDYMKFIMAFFFGELMKLVLSGILFLLVVKYLAISLLSVLIGFIVAMIAFWVVSLACFAKK